MKKNDEIAAELNALRANFGRAATTDSTFHVPDGYFRHFPDQITGIIRAMNAETSFDAGASKEGPFELPSGYFDQLSGTIMQKISAMETIANDTAGPWNDTGKHNPYSLPENYFVQFEQRLMNTLFREETAVAEEIETLSPLLADLREEQPFAVPKGYFNSETLVQRAQQSETKVIEHPAVRSIKWARWAAAAAVIGIFLTGGLHFLNPSSGLNSRQSFERSLAQIPDARIKEWLISNMDEADINNLGSSVANIKVNNASPHSLNNYSEKELRDYLEAELW